MIAFLTNSIQKARVDIRASYLSIWDTFVYGRVKNNEGRYEDFRIITQPYELDGIELSAFHVVGSVDPELVELAETRIRPIRDVSPEYWTVRRDLRKALNEALAGGRGFQHDQDKNIKRLATELGKMGTPLR